MLRVLVKAGDTVTTVSPSRAETDKATIEVPSSVSGTVGEVKVKPGEKVQVGQTIFTVSGNGAAAKDAKPDAASRKPDAEGEKPDAASQEPETESRKPEAPSAPPAPVARQPEDEIIDAPKPRRGEVVDIGRGPRAAAQGASASADSGPAPAAAPWSVASRASSASTSGRSTPPDQAGALPSKTCRRPCATLASGGGGARQPATRRRSLARLLEEWARSRRADQQHPHKTAEH